MSDKELPYSSDTGDHIRDGLQRRLNDEGEEAFLVHYVVLAGVSVPTDNGWKTRAVVYEEPNQPDYVTSGLLGLAGPLLDQMAVFVEVGEDEDEETEPDP